jgi:basic membrane protein A and related proteins
MLNLLIREETTVLRTTKRRTPLITLAVALAVLASACGSSKKASTTATTAGAAPTTAAKNYKWIMVTDQAGLGDKGFNDLAKAGVDQCATQFGGTSKAIESAEQAQYVPNLQQAVASGASLTVGVGFLIQDAMAQVALANPNSHFVLIDAVAVDSNKNPVPNVQSVQFKENEGAYLAGIIAGMTTKTNRFGFVGGIEIPPVVRFLTGFKAALKAVNPQARVDVAYVGSFNDPAKVKETADGFYGAGADVVFEVAGAGGLGAYEAAKARGKGFWVMGTDTCKQQLAPDEYLTSATKDVKGAVVRGGQQVVNGTFKGGSVTLGLADDAVGVCQATFDSLPQNIKDAVNKAKAAIKSGSLVVPATPQELATFTPPSS